MQPIRYPIYKGTGGKHGAIQIKFQPPHNYAMIDGKRVKDFSGRRSEDPETGRPKEGWNTREGAIFMEITSTKGKNVYDWDSKIVLALSVNDMGEILYFLATGRSSKGSTEEFNGEQVPVLNLMHDPGAKTEAQGTIKKFFKMSCPGGLAKGVMVTVTQMSGSNRVSHTVPINGAEIMVLRTLLQESIVKALAW